MVEITEQVIAAPHQEDVVVLHADESAGALVLKNLQNSSGRDSVTLTDGKIQCKNGSIDTHVQIVSPKSATIDKLIKERKQANAQGSFRIDLQEWTIQDVAPVILLFYVGDIMEFPSDRSEFNRVLERLEASPPEDDPRVPNVERTNNNSKYRLRCILKENGQNQHVFVRADGTVEAVPQEV